MRERDDVTLIANVADYIGNSPTLPTLTPCNPPISLMVSLLNHALMPFAELFCALRQAQDEGIGVIAGSQVLKRR
jgi:hypothetical protein